MTENFWDERYSLEEYVYGEKPNEFLASQLNQIPQGKILFPCEGEGRNAVFAALNGWQVTAFDSSKKGKEKALKLAKKNGVEITYQVADAQAVEYPAEEYDALAFIYAHFPPEARTIIHKRAVKWLKPGGVVILEAFNSKQLNNHSGGPKKAAMLYTPEMLLNDFEELEIQLRETTQTTLTEGKFHNGLADVIRFVGIKKKKNEC